MTESIVQVREINDNPAVIAAINSQPVILDRNLALRRAVELYDNLDPVFTAAFRNTANTMFMHPDCEKFRPLWLTTGLHHRRSGQYAPGDFLLCIENLAARYRACNSSRALESLDQDAIAILKPLTDPPSSLSLLSVPDWTDVSEQKVFIETFRTDRFRSFIPSESRMSPEPPSLLSMQEIILEKYFSISWTQTRTPRHKPTEAAMMNTVHHGKPSIDMVWRHLRRLRDLSGDLGGTDLMNFISDLSATYEYLQANFEFPSDQRVSISEQDLWLNAGAAGLDQATVQDLKDSWVSSSQLVLFESSDRGKFQYVRPGLAEYQGLLRKLNCNIFRVPQILEPSIHESQSMMSRLQKLRVDGKMFDVTFRVEGQEVHAHRIVLAAASIYCAASFSGRWEISDNPIQLNANIFSFTSIKAMIDFAYDVPVGLEELEIKQSDSKEDTNTKLRKLLDLYGAADYFGMPDLACKVENKIMSSCRMSLRGDNVDWVRRLGELKGASRVVKFCNELRELNVFMQIG